MAMMGSPKQLKRQRTAYNFELLGAVIFFAGLFCLSDLVSPPITRLILGPKPSATQTDSFDWNLLPPSKELEYHPCYGHFQCARLKLPMDWTADEGQLWDHTVAIALLKLPANVSVSDPRYGGEIYVNPGGPGGSGVLFARRSSDLLAGLVSAGRDGNKLYDIVGFDPRGVMHSTPLPDCFATLKSRQLWFHMKEGYEAPSNSDQTMNKLLARTEAFRKICNPGEKTTDGELLKQHLSSAHVARDLLAIIDRSAEMQSKALKTQQPSNRHASLLHSETVPSRGMLQYWGFSYGTTIGVYFATLYPDRVERMILDANMHVEKWIAGDRSGFITQIDSALARLYSSCYLGGPEKCALYDPGGPPSIERAVTSSLERLRNAPIPLWKDGMLLPEILTYEKVVASMFSSLYSPYKAFPRLAQGLAALKDGTNMSALEYFLPAREFICADDACRAFRCLDKSELYPDAGLAILNSDTAFNGTSKDLFDIATMLKRQSPLFGEKFQLDVAMGWNAWPVEPKWRYTGPIGGQTKHPILFIGNTGDPVGPVENAIENAKPFNGSVVLTQDTVSHGSISAPSLCTANYILEYFQAGTLPPSGTVCAADWLPFEDPATAQGMAASDVRRMQVLQDLVHQGFTLGSSGHVLF